MGWDGMGWDGMGREGVGWIGMGCDGKARERMRRDGMGWDGMGCRRGWHGEGSNPTRICPRERVVVCREQRATSSLIEQVPHHGVSDSHAVKRGGASAELVKLSASGAKARGCGSQGKRLSVTRQARGCGRQVLRCVSSFPLQRDLARFLYVDLFNVSSSWHGFGFGSVERHDD